MGNFIDKGNDGFASVRNTNFVDKSMLIEEVNSVMLTENRYMCVTRARRFGKSVAVKMLNAYMTGPVAQRVCSRGWRSAGSLTSRNI